MDRIATTDFAEPDARASVFSRLSLYALLLAGLAVLAAASISTSNLGLFYLRRQDQWLLIVGAILMLACLRTLPDRRRMLTADWRFALAVGGIMALVAFVGHHAIMSGYDLSLDERFANFDAAILASGHFAAPLPPQWQDHSHALNTMFMYNTGHREAWISSYLPSHAALRALIGITGVPSLTGPLMILIAALALWACARRIWPDNREAPVVALLLYTGAGQIWLNGMTAYAMPAHLALNLCWLWLFLRRSWWGDAGALAIGFVAVGLHQIHYHPLFAAPILFLLLLERNWLRAGYYAFGYAAIGIFWQLWAYWSATWVVGGPLPPDAAHVDILSRIIGNWAKVEGLRLPNMIENLLRMAAWQHLLLLPLVALGVRVARRDRLAAALLGGIVLTLAVRIAFQPYQGHGLGYRYLHGLIGNLILLAVYGWVSLGQDMGRWRSLLLRTTAASCLILVPIQAWMAHGFYAPYAAVSHRIGSIAADYVVIGAKDVPFSGDFVRNDPYLDNRPVRLLREAIDPALQAQLCSSRPTVALIGTKILRPAATYFGTSPSASLESDNLDLATSLYRLGCYVERY